MIQLILLLLMNTVVKGLEVKSINASLENVYNFPISREQKHILVYETIGELFQKNHVSRFVTLQYYKTQNLVTCITYIWF